MKCVSDIQLLKDFQDLSVSVLQAVALMNSPTVCQHRLAKDLSSPEQ